MQILLLGRNKKKQPRHRSPRAHDMTVGLQETQPSKSLQAAGQGGLPFLLKSVFWLVLLLVSEASRRRPDTSGQHSAASRGVWWRGTVPALQRRRTPAQRAKGSEGSHQSTWGRAGSPLPLPVLSSTDVHRCWEYLQRRVQGEQ